MNNERLLDILGEIDDKYIAEAAPAAKKAHCRPIWIKWGTIAACMILLISSCFGVVAEAAEYNSAVNFFISYGMSTDGLTRREIKAVYRDIITKSFTYHKTAEVILESISVDNTIGYEIFQDNPSPKDIENLWYYKTVKVRYSIYDEYKPDGNTNGRIFVKSHVRRYEDGKLIWSTAVPGFNASDTFIVSDGVIVSGTKSKNGNPYFHLAKIDSNGNLLWQAKHDNGVEYEKLSVILENDDGSYTVFSNADHQYLCFSQYAADGERTHFNKTEIDRFHYIKDVERLGDGYIVRIQKGYNTKILKLDRNGNVTDSFSYSDENSYYHITNMIEFNGNIYLSAYSIPKHNADAGSELSDVWEYLRNNNLTNISSKKLTPMIRNNYTAILLVCNQKTGKVEEFYSIKGSLGSTLSINDSGNLTWDVESITTTSYSPSTNLYTFAGASYVFRYTYNASGLLISQEKTGEVVSFIR